MDKSSAGAMSAANKWLGGPVYEANGLRSEWKRQDELYNVEVLKLARIIDAAMETERRTAKADRDFIIARGQEDDFLQEQNTKLLAALKEVEIWLFDNIVDDTNPPQIWINIRIAISKYEEKSK